MRKNKDLFSIFPADAGVNLQTLLRYPYTGHIPRGCGGEPFLDVRILHIKIYSPRMRG